MWEGCVRGCRCSVTLRYCIPAPPTRPHLPMARPRPCLVSIPSFRLRSWYSRPCLAPCQARAPPPSPCLLLHRVQYPFHPALHLYPLHILTIPPSTPPLHYSGITTALPHPPALPHPRSLPPAPLSLSAHHTFQGIFLLLLKCHRT